MNFVLFCLGGMLAEEYMNQICCNPYTAYNQDRGDLLEELRLYFVKIQRSGSFIIILDSDYVNIVPMFMLIIRGAKRLRRFKVPQEGCV